ncbi:MAG: flagellar basal body L-ring protein FlgH [Planctomycetes bacterium]|nr:flagellar basal body L-ring protein FlgH [Planctomycetota bacterium]
MTFTLGILNLRPRPIEPEPPPPAPPVSRPAESYVQPGGVHPGGVHPGGVHPGGVHRASGALSAALALGALLSLLAPTPARADSLWPEGETESLVGDLPPRKFEKHDLVTLVVDEKSLASASADTRSDRRTRLEIALAKWIRFTRKKGGETGDLTGQLDDFGLETALGEDSPEIDLDARVRGESPASTKRESQFRLNVQAEVVDILPNGNLVIEARKHRTVNEETETITLCGIIRPGDVDATNSIRSDRVADLDVKLIGDGAVGDKQKRGLLSRLLDWLWPF